MSSPSSILRDRGLLAVLTAEIVSTLGTRLTAVALPWFVLTTTGSPARSGLVLAAQTAPVLLLGVVSGSWVERIGARVWMVLADVCRAPMIALVPVLSMLDLLPFWGLLGLVFLIGAFEVPYNTSQQMLLAEAVGENERRLTQATSVLQGATRLTLMLGPPLAGALIVAVGAQAVLFVDAATYLVVALIIAVWGPGTSRHESDAQGRLLDGIRELRRDRLLSRWSLATIVNETAYQALFLSIPIVVYLEYHESATVVGLLVAAFGVGAFIGSVASALMTRWVRAVPLSVVGKVVQALLFWGAVAVPGPVWFAALLLLLGLANGVVNGPSFAVRLAHITVAVRARALSAMTAGSMLGATVGLALAGPAFEAFDSRTVFIVLAVLQLGSAALFADGARFARGPRSTDAERPTDGRVDRREEVRTEIAEEAAAAPHASTPGPP